MNPMKLGAARAFTQGADISLATRPTLVTGRRRRIAQGLACVGALTVAIPTLAVPPPGPFKQTNIHFETNASACDMGIQMSFDTNGITRAEVESPQGLPVFKLRAVPGAETTDDITETFQERVEPPIVDFQVALGCEPSEHEPISLAQLLEAWPAGVYEFSGVSQGMEYEGISVLSHKVPAGPEILAPAEGDVVNPNRDLRVRWNKVTTPIIPELGPVEVVGYHVLVVDVTNPVLAPGQTKTAFDADVSGNETSFLVPKEFLEPKRIYEFEILATEKGRNQTITEGGVFCTAPIKAQDCTKP